MDLQNLQGHSLRAHTGDIQRTNNQLHPLMQNNSDDRGEFSRKLLQMGFPTHRHPPPPGFAKPGLMGPPPGFKAVHENNAKFRFPNCRAPFPRASPMDNLTMNCLSQSPPKPYCVSPPKNYMCGNMYHHERMPHMNVRHELPMPSSDSMHHRMWSGQLPTRMPQHHTDHRKRTN